MKKKYIAPSIEMEACETDEFLIGVSSELGIGYGGVDENGEHEADSRSSRFQMWGDDSEE
jgi:hypothetical protein